MKIGIMQPYFFPYIGYWQLINAVDKIVLYDDVNFINRGWINRNRILENGDSSYINVLVEKKSQNKKINELYCVTEPSWKERLVKRIKLNYSKAPFFDENLSIIENLIYNKEDNLAKYLEGIIKGMAEYLDINTEIMVSSEIKKDTSLNGQDKILNICESLGGTEYINLMGGITLYDKEAFKKKNIDLYFIKSKEIKYKQFEYPFLENLSIIDVLLFCGLKETKGYLDKYLLI